MVVKKGWRRSGRKWFIRLDRNRVAVLVNNVHLIDRAGACGMVCWPPSKYNLHRDAFSPLAG